MWPGYSYIFLCISTISLKGKSQRKSLCIGNDDILLMMLLLFNNCQQEGLDQFRKDYIKIQFVARQTVRSALSDKRQLLKIAILSLIESLRANPIKFDALIHRTPSTVVMSKSTMIDYVGSSYHTNPFLYSPNQDGYDEALVEALVNEAAIIYEKMVKDFTNHTITNAAAGGSSNLSSSMTYLDEQVSHAPKLFAYRYTTQTSVYDR